MILALDLGTRTGWATEFEGVIEHGFVDFKTKRMESPGMRYVRFRRWLAEQNPDRIVFEEVRRHIGTSAAHVYGAFLGIVTAHCAERGIDFVGVPVGTIKKFATGKGNAGKREMIVAANEHILGRKLKLASEVDIVDDNEADAYWILQYAKKELSL